MTKRPFFGILFAVLALSLLVILAGLFYFLGGSRLLAGPAPQVHIVQPEDTLAIRSGETLLILVDAISESSVARVDLFVDGELVDSRSPAESNSKDFLTLFNWFSAQVGEHDVQVIAVDRSGKSSDPAALSIAVYPRVAAQHNGFPENLPPDGQVEVVSQDLPTAAEAPRGSGGDTGGDGSQDDDNNGGQQDAVAPPQVVEPPIQNGEPLPGPADQAPVIESFDDELQFDGNHFVVMLTAHAADDVGIDHLEFEAFLHGTDLGGFHYDCAGAPVCDYDSSFQLFSGEWVYSVTAIDTSGQASVPAIVLIEVLGEDGEPPAAANHDENWNNWFAERFGDLTNPDLNIDWSLVQPNLDISEFMDVFGDPSPVDDQDELRRNCIEVTAGSGQGANTLSFVVTCPDLQAPEGQILYPHIDKRLAFQQDGGISLHISDWYDETRTNFALGDSLSWTDNDVVCGMTYEYAVRIDYAVVNDPGRNSASAVGIAGTAVYQEVEIPPLLGCPENDPGNVSMTATLDAANVMQVDWAFQANAAWPQDPPLDNGLRVQLLRYSPFFDEQVILLDEVHTLEEINAQPAFHVSDADLQCNNQYWYTLQVIAADANLDLVSPGWIVRQPVEAPVFPCEVGRLDDWFDVSTFWYNDRYHRALVEVEVPDGAQFPTGDIVEIRLEYYLAGDGECRQAPCDGNYHVFDSKRLQNGRLVTPVYEDFFDLGCGGDEILVRMAIAEDGVGVEYSNTVSVYNEPCPPHTPQIVSLFATTEDCPANVERCVYIEWEPYQQDLNGEENAPAVQLVVQRRNLNETGYTEFPVLLDSTSFVDTNPLSYNLNAQPGFQCQAPVLYRLVAYGENGRFQGASPLQLYGLTCDGPWNTHQEAN